LERSGARKTPRNQLTNKDLNAEVALDVKGNASKLVVQSFLNRHSSRNVIATLTKAACAMTAFGDASRSSSTEEL
jgi:hypothetical protein